MSRTLGTVARGVRTPIFREGDNVVEGVVSSVLTALKENGIQPHDKDVAAVTESVVARCQGNYATVEQIAAARLWASPSPSSAATASPCCSAALPPVWRRWC